MIYEILTATGTIREHQRHEVTRRTAYLRRLGIPFTVTVDGSPAPELA